MKKLLFCLLVLSYTLSSCSKHCDSSANQFIINGIHDVDMGSETDNSLNLTVLNKSGQQEQVTIRALNLPDGIRVIATPAAGIPDYTAVLTFEFSGVAKAGSYPVQIVGESSVSSVAYSINLKVPAFNGFFLAGKAYRTSGISTKVVNGHSFFDITSSDYGGVIVHGDTPANWPIANGTATFPTGQGWGYAMNLSLDDYHYQTFNSPANPPGVVNMVVTNGQVAISSSEVILTNSVTGHTQTLMINASQ